MGFEQGQAAGQGLVGRKDGRGILGVEVPFIPATLTWHLGAGLWSSAAGAQGLSEPRTRACD